MVGDEHTNPSVFQETDDTLDFDHRDRIDAGEWLVEQYEPRSGRQGACDFNPPTFAA